MVENVIMIAIEGELKCFCSYGYYWGPTDGTGRNNVFFDKFPLFKQRSVTCNMRVSCRGIILLKDKVLVIKRKREQHTYYTFPGGGLEGEESLEECVVRELKEETGLEVAVGSKFAVVKGADSEQYFFICHVIGGELGCGSGEEIKKYTSEEYKIGYSDLSELLLVDNIFRQFNLLDDLISLSNKESINIPILVEVENSLY